MIPIFFCTSAASLSINIFYIILSLHKPKVNIPTVNNLVFEKNIAKWAKNFKICLANFAIWEYNKCNKYYKCKEEESTNEHTAYR